MNISSGPPEVWCSVAKSSLAKYPSEGASVAAVCNGNFDKRFVWVPRECFPRCSQRRSAASPSRGLSILNGGRAVGGWKVEGGVWNVQQGDAIAANFVGSLRPKWQYIVIPAPIILRLYLSPSHSLAFKCCLFIYYKRKNRSVFDHILSASSQRSWRNLNTFLF